MDNFNIDPNTMENIKNMVDNGDISSAISQISPEMLQNFSKMLGSNSQSPENSSNSNDNSNARNKNSSQGNNNSNSSNGFDFGNIDANTILKMKSVMDKMNNKNDPRSNLLSSLKPYLRDTRQDKLDQYVNLLNISKIADVLNPNGNGDKKN